MSDSSRRGFLKLAGAGAAAAGAVVAGTGDDDPAEVVALPRSVVGPILVHVHDVRTGEISLMVEDHEVTVVDHDLAARIGAALHRHAHRHAPRTVDLPIA